MIHIGYVIDCKVVCLADKVVLAGKIMIFVVSMPIISNLFEMIVELI